MCLVPCSNSYARLQKCNGVRGLTCWKQRELVELDGAQPARLLHVATELTSSRWDINNINK